MNVLDYDRATEAAAIWRAEATACDDRPTFDKPEMAAYCLALHLGHACAVARASMEHFRGAPA